LDVDTLRCDCGYGSEPDPEIARLRGALATAQANEAAWEATAQAHYEEIARLKAENESLTAYNEEHQSLAMLQDMQIEKLRAENERLREALRGLLDEMRLTDVMNSSAANKARQVLRSESD
jgi:predicted nuclease with TOPRIM domain